MDILLVELDTVRGCEFVGTCVDVCNIPSNSHEPISVAGMLKWRLHRWTTGRHQLFIACH